MRPLWPYSSPSNLLFLFVYLCLCLMDGSYSRAWLEGGGRLGAHSNRNPAQSIKHFHAAPVSASSESKVRTLFLFLFLHLDLHLSCPSRLVDRGTDCRFFVPAYGKQIHGRTDAGALSHAPVRAQAFISRGFSVGLFTTLSYQALISWSGQDLIRKQIIS